MAIDIPRRVLKSQKNSGRTEPVSRNPYLRLLSQLYSFLARRTESRFNKVVSKRLCMSRRNKPTMSVARLIDLMAKHEDKIACIVGSVTDDKRVESMPAVTVCALRFTKEARAKIEKNGGECLTFDQLALRAPKGNGCMLLRGNTKSRVAEKHFGRAPGLPGSHTRPYACPKASH